MLSKISFLMLSTWFALGLTAFTQVIVFNDPPRHLTLIEAIYLSIQIVTTVGYGDLTPSQPTGQLFVACYILVGVSLVAILLGQLMDRTANKNTEPPLAEEEPAHVDMHASCEGSVGAEDRPSAEADSKARAATPEDTHPAGLSGVVHRKLSFQRLSRGAMLAKMAAMTHHGENNSIYSLARCVAFFLLFLVIGTVFFWAYPGEDKSIWLAFYMSCVTLTSVGFGHTHPVTQGGYLFATFWMLIGVSCCANMICTLGNVLMSRRKASTSTLKTEELLSEMDADGNGKVDKVEFMKFELVRKGFCHMQEIDTVLALFAHLDKDGSGELDVEEMRTFVEEEAAASAGMNPALHWR